MQNQLVRAELKYRDALSLYRDTSLSIKSICERTGVGFSAFSSYLSKRHRELIIERHNLTAYPVVKLRGKKGQTTLCYHKYNGAISACASEEYIEYNISQIARIFNVDCCCLAGQLRRHYPDIISRREKERKRKGITTNLQYGARKCSKDAYLAAVDRLQSSDMTIEEVAGVCNVSYSGLREHLSAYHPEIILQREQKRNSAVGESVRGKRTGSWCLHEPNETTIAKYESAIELYRNTSSSVKDIVLKSGVSLSGFRHYLRSWHPELMVRRREVKLKQKTGTTKSTTEKYAEVLHLYETTPESLKSIACRLGLTYSSVSGYIRRNHPEAINTHNSLLVSSEEKFKAGIKKLQDSDSTINAVMHEFGYNEYFRTYIKTHHPELLERKVTREKNRGKKVTAEKYTAAIEQLQRTSQSLKEAAEKTGVNFHSFRKYVSKYRPDLLGRRDLKR